MVSEMVRTQKNRSYLKEDIPAYVEDCLAEEGITPSIDEVAEHFGISKATAHRYLLMLDEEGILKYSHRIGIPAWMQELMQKIQDGRCDRYDSI